MNLARPAIESYWQGTDAGMLAVFRRMEAGEHWVVDQAEALEARVVALGNVLGKINPESCSEDERDALSLLLGFCHSGRAFRILAFLDKEAPGFSVGLLRDAERRLADTHATPASILAAQVHIDRYSYLMRFQLLGRIYSRERMEHLARIIEEIS